ncbi:hypothetical protein CCR75_008941 [Bremia lactucae]|uniref:WW domain-containing protein n=1 Tax=Bremia lactucae TaxID=4779 RepID=A0A976IJC2_BRELC|nr:hypothetical protein CCR75_008941 [Bremia lactucae]
MSSVKTKSTRTSKQHVTRKNEWQAFTSPDGHVYYCNATTKESRWEPPDENESELRLKVGKRNRARKEEISIEQVASLKQKLSLNTESTPQLQKNHGESLREKMATDAITKPQHAIFQKIQASLEGRLQGPMMGTMKLPSMLDIRSKEEENTPEMQAQTLEEQYEGETVGMSAAERLRFLRKKRKKSMITKRVSVAEDDFMAEVANNMKKKGTVMKHHGGEREQSEKHQKRQQIQKEMEEKKTEKRQSQERTEHLKLEQDAEDDKKKRQENESAKSKKKKDTNLFDTTIITEDTNPVASWQLNSADRSKAPAEDVLDVSALERKAQKKHKKSKSGKSIRVEEHKNGQLGRNSESLIIDAHNANTEAELDLAHTKQEKKEARIERRARRMLDGKLAVATLSARGATLPSEASLTTQKQVLSIESKLEGNQSCREQRRIAKMEAAFAAQSLESNKNENVHSEHVQRVNNTSEADSSSGHVGGHTMHGQPLSSQAAPDQPIVNGGLFPLYPYVIMSPLPPYGYYNPYTQMPVVPMPVYSPGTVQPGYQFMPSTSPPLTDSIAALVAYSAESTLASSYELNLSVGQQALPKLTKCEHCKGIGVGLVEKNGICAHCNRLRLAFIVDSAQMRRRCSRCGGWGYQLLQANGMCTHCNRQTAQKAQAKLLTKAATQSQRVGTTMRQNSMMTVTQNERLSGNEWDKSSSDDSDWDD